MIGFLGNYLFERTGLPDMLFLIILGILFGPVLRVFDPSAVTDLAPYIAALALVFILFDGGMRMELRQVLSHSPRAVLLAALGFLFSVFVVALFMVFFFGMSLPYGFLFGSIYGGSSSIVVVSLAAKIKVSQKCSTTLILESATTDILCIVISLAIIGVIMTGQADYKVVSLEIARKFIVGAILGIVFGLSWLILLKRVISVSFSYMLTLAILLLAYALSEYLGGSGALSSLLFGLTLGNEREILRIAKREIASETVVDEGLKRFESEIAFLIRTFFFVFLGLIATISNIGFLFLGIILSLLLLLVRFGAVWVATVRSELKSERPIMAVVLTRGLAAAVLATLPIQYGLLYSDVFINLAVVIIVSTAIIATVGVFLVSRKTDKHQ
ncbi:MAG TPA: cation:proton antiporter [Acidobacteriota bacterium]|nr:cation:proton antiporter [Acidobacteriota bacterium]